MPGNAFLDIFYYILAIRFHLSLSVNLTLHFLNLADFRQLQIPNALTIISFSCAKYVACFILPWEWESDLAFGVTLLGNPDVWYYFINPSYFVIWMPNILYDQNRNSQLSRNRSIADKIRLSVKDLVTLSNACWPWYVQLTNLPLDKMAALSQTTFSNAFFWIKSFVFWLKFHWSLFLMIQLTITEYWLR